MLTRLGWERGLPTTIACDNGTEFTSRALDQFRHINAEVKRFLRAGKPVLSVDAKKRDVPSGARPSPVDEE